MTIVDVDRLCAVAVTEFSDIVLDAFPLDLNSLRIILLDSTFIDIWYSLKLADRYSYHWERKAIDGRIFRHDNAPHSSWRHVATFPGHFHNGSEEIVATSDLPRESVAATRAFLQFARVYLASASRQ